MDIGFGAPLLIQTNELAKTYNVYTCLIIFFSAARVLTFELSANTILPAFKSFIARRGRLGLYFTTVAYTSRQPQNICVEYHTYCKNLVAI